MSAACCTRLNPEDWSETVRETSLWATHQPDMSQVAARSLNFRPPIPAAAR